MKFSATVSQQKVTDRKPFFSQGNPRGEALRKTSKVFFSKCTDALMLKIFLWTLESMSSLLALVSSRGHDLEKGVQISGVLDGDTFFSCYS